VRVFPGSLAAEAGLRAGDVLLRAGDVPADSPQMFGFRYRLRYRDADGQPLVLTWRRNGQEMAGRGTVKSRTTRAYRVSADPGAPAQTRAILEGILAGR
jgi:S1-C subfamily serine protease